MKRHIKKVAVIGSGIMGSGIACHFANIGVEVLLLDILPKEMNTPGDPKERNSIAYTHLQNALKINPSPIYEQNFISRIQIGNLQDDLEKLKDCDWIIEVVVERLDIKKQVFTTIEEYRREGSLVSTNTSGIPIHLISKGRSEDFKKHFAGTHFFNPVRYLPLLEIIPTPETDASITDFYMNYGRQFLGKTTVLCKDTPAFIANRIGVYGIMNIFNSIQKMGLRVEEVDKLTGPVIGRPKSATFRTADVVGIDTLIHVANGVRENCPNDERNSEFILPEYLRKMQENNWLGSKTGQGFYKKIKNEEGNSEILSLDLNTLEYTPQEKSNFPTLELTKSIDKVIDRFSILLSGQDKAGEFYRYTFGALFAYVSHRIPEISDDIYRIDDAMKNGFGWQNGPFEIWDKIGIQKGIEIAEEQGFTVAYWVKNRKENTFYTLDKEYHKEAYHPENKKYESIPGQAGMILLDNLRAEKTLWSNSGTSIIDLGDGILNLEFHSKMNAMGAEVLEGINKAIDLAEKEYEGLVIYNNGQNFSVGANLAMIMTLAIDQDWEDLNFAIQHFQNTMMRVRYSSIPVVVAPHQMTLGGGCEITLHADKVVAHSETYIGLVELGVGVIPAGGGTKEMVKRTTDKWIKDDVQTNRLRDTFMNIAMAKVATSAYEAYALNILQKYKDTVIVNRNLQLQVAKNEAKAMAEKGYSKPIPEKVLVLGKEARGIFYVGSDQMFAGKYISEYDQFLANKLAHVMVGGNLSEKTYVSEDYLLNLERETFLSLCGERKTLERIQSMLKTGKPLRN